MHVDRRLAIAPNTLGSWLARSKRCVVRSWSDTCKCPSTPETRSAAAKLLRVALASGVVTYEYSSAADQVREAGYVKTVSVDLI